MNTEKLTNAYLNLMSFWAAITTDPEGMSEDEAAYAEVMLQGAEAIGEVLEEAGVVLPDYAQVKQQAEEAISDLIELDLISIRTKPN